MTANDKQISGTHYKKCEIEPWDYIARNNIPYLEGNAIKYITRWRDKGGIEDIQKAIHYLEKVIELEAENNPAVYRRGGRRMAGFPESFYGSIRYTDIQHGEVVPIFAHTDYGTSSIPSNYDSSLCPNAEVVSGNRQKLAE